MRKNSQKYVARQIVKEFDFAVIRNALWELYLYDQTPEQLGIRSKEDMAQAIIDELDMIDDPEGHEDAFVYIEKFVKP